MSGELRLTSLRGRWPYPPAFAEGDKDGVVGRGSPDVWDWEGKGDFGIVNDGLGAPLREGRGDAVWMVGFAGRSARDCLGVDVAEGVLGLTSAEGGPRIEWLDSEDALEDTRGRCNAPICGRRPTEGYLALAPGGRGGSVLS